MNPYQTLNVPRDATDDEIKQAYKQEAKRTHPDKGGDEETFKNVSRAFALLSNPEKRRYYDEHGEEKGNDLSPEQKAIQITQELVAQIIENIDPTDLPYTDVIGKMRTAVENNLAKLRKERSSQLKDIERLKKTKEAFDKRLKVKDGKNMFEMHIRAKEAAIRQTLGHLDEQERTLDAAMAIVRNYEFSFDEKPSQEPRHSLGQYMRPYSSIFGTSTF